MKEDEPAADDVDDVVEVVSVRDAVESGLRGEDEEEELGGCARSAGKSASTVETEKGYNIHCLDAWDHTSCAERLHEQDVRHYREDIVMRRKGREPL